MNNGMVEEISGLKRRYDHDGLCLLPALYLVQREYGWISPEALEKVGEILNVPKATAKSVSTFYAMFRHQPMGRHLIQLCTNVSCTIMGGERLLDILKARYGLEPYATAPGGRFSLVIMECLGACETAPAMLVDTDLHGNLTEDTLMEILERYE